MFAQNRWLRQLERVILVTVGLALACPAVRAQAPSARPSAGPPTNAPSNAPSSAPQSNAPPAAKPAGTGGLADLNPYAEDAETVAARYRVPQTDDVTELMAFIIYLRRFEPRDTQTYLIHRKQMPIAVKAAAEKILRVEKDATILDENGVRVHTNAWHQASMLVLVADVQMLADLTPAQQRELFVQINKRLAVTHPPQGDFLLAMQFATRLESTSNTALAGEVYNAFAPIFSKSEDSEISEMGKTFVAASRRMNLVGKPMEVVGRTVDGKQFDWKAYRGKVVLVDYWATWCKPCRDELPNVKRLYRLYHDRGFDVVGVNVDETRAEADAFLKTEAIPWANLFDTTSSGDHPMTSYYGVIGFPTVMLVGRDGNVVALDARGEKLQELLAKMLGPAGDGPPDDPRNARSRAQPGAR